MTKRILALMGAMAGAVALAGSAMAGQPVPGGVAFQDAGSPTMERINELHNILLIVITLIVAFVTALLVWVMIRYNRRANANPAPFHHNTLLEVVWTAVPIAILVGLAVPSFNLLTYLEEVPEVDFTVKATGQNWYWDFEYPDHGNFAFTARVLDKETAKANGAPYLLATDYHMVVPVGATVRVEVTAGERLHSFAVPSLGMKVDAVPGRLNDTWFKAEREGLFYGQCSELCGAYHAYMPIVVEVVSPEAFAAWTERMKTEFGALDTPTQVASVR